MVLPSVLGTTLPQSAGTDIHRCRQRVLRFCKRAAEGRNIDAKLLQVIAEAIVPLLDNPKCHSVERSLGLADPRGKRPSPVNISTALASPSSFLPRCFDRGPSPMPRSTQWTAIDSEFQILTTRAKDGDRDIAKCLVGFFGYHAKQGTQPPSALLRHISAALRPLVEGSSAARSRHRIAQALGLVKPGAGRPALPRDDLAQAVMGLWADGVPDAQILHKLREEEDLLLDSMKDSALRKEIDKAISTPHRLALAELADGASVSKTADTLHRLFAQSAAPSAGLIARCEALSEAVEWFRERAKGRVSLPYDDGYLEVLPDDPEWKGYQLAVAEVFAQTSQAAGLSNAAAKRLVRYLKVDARVNSASAPQSVLNNDPDADLFLAGALSALGDD